MASQEEKAGWFSRLKAGLSRSSGALGKGLTDVLVKRKLDDETLEELGDLLVSADLGVKTAAEMVELLRLERHDKEITMDEVRGVLAAKVSEILAPLAQPFAPSPDHNPTVVLVVGVNGTGKTTTIGKLARYFRGQGLSVMLAAADTFRAAAIEQLRAGVPVHATAEGADPASVAFDALERARAEGVDLLLIDTAGRLQNKSHLMDELEKIRRVLAKQDEAAPHATLLVLDATTGQNALNQVAVFREVAAVSGLIMTKLDGTAKGGILVACAREHGLPVHAIGIGEGVDDLRPLDAEAFARALVGLEDNAHD